MRRLAMAVTMLCLAAAAGRASDTKPPAETPKAPAEKGEKPQKPEKEKPVEIRWIRDMAAALKQAKEQRRPTMVDFYTDWCGWCKKLDKEVYTDRTVAQLAAGFVSVKINAEKEEELAEKYEVEGFPNIVFTDARGKIVERIGGFVPAEGMRAKMLAVLTKTGGIPKELRREFAGAAARAEKLLERRKYADALFEVRLAGAIKESPKKVKHLMGVIEAHALKLLDQADGQVKAKQYVPAIETYLSLRDGYDGTKAGAEADKRLQQLSRNADALRAWRERR